MAEWAVADDPRGDRKVLMARENSSEAALGDEIVTMECVARLGIMGDVVTPEYLMSSPVWHAGMWLPRFKGWACCRPFLSPRTRSWRQMKLELI